METKGTPTPSAEQFEAVAVAESTCETTAPVTDSDIVPQEDATSAVEVMVEESTEPEVDYSAFTKEELVTKLAHEISEKPVGQLKQTVEQIKVAFYKKHNDELASLKAEFETQNAENPEAEFIAPEDKLEGRLKELINLYREKRDQFIASSEEEKQNNYKEKLAIIEELKELTNSSETLHNTFTAFRELQKRWKETGIVPQTLVRDLWETYNHHVENFYNYIKINKELRDLDLKKNYEAKFALCEEAEQLMIEPSPVAAFHKLQKLHTDWRETGPVAPEFKEQLWERFKQASSHVNKRHQEHFDGLKEEQMANLKLKEELCDKVETLATTAHPNRNDWEKASEQIIEIQKVWKTIGFAPKKDNNKIYERFREACDKFFNAKREFFDGVKNELADNYQAKLDLCVQAEALVENIVDFKQTTQDVLELQKRWKEVGPTSRKYSEAVWGRFRAACDKFFEAKSKHFEQADSQYNQNLEAKQAIVAELKAMDMATATFDMLKDIQRRWSSIGFVPIKAKDALQKEYKTLSDKLYDTIRSAEGSRRVENFKGRVSQLKESGRVGSERDKLSTKLRSLETEIATLENNIGFFGNSKNAEMLVKEVRNKIDKAKKEYAEIVEKIKIIDNQ